MSKALGGSPSFVIDSRSRQAGITSDFIYKINLKPNHKFNYMAVVSANVPKSYYLVEAARNNAYFVLTEGASSATVTLPDGNYNVTSFQPLMETALNNASISMGHAFMYNITFPNTNTETQTNKFTYSVSNNAGVQPVFTFGVNSTGMSNMMGFNDFTSNTFVADTIISTITVRFQHTFYVQIKSSSARQPNSGDDDTSILATLPVGNTVDGNFINYEMIDLSDAGVELTNPNSNQFTFSLYDDDDQLLNLQGQDWTMRIMIYTYNNISDLQINDLHLKYLTDTPKEAYVEEHDPAAEEDANK